MNELKVERWQQDQIREMGYTVENKRSDEEMRRGGAAKLETKEREVLIERGATARRDKLKETVYKWERKKDNGRTGSEARRKNCS